MTITLLEERDTIHHPYNKQFIFDPVAAHATWKCTVCKPEEIMPRQHEDAWEGFENDDDWSVAAVAHESFDSSDEEDEDDWEPPTDTPETTPSREATSTEEKDDSEEIKDEIVVSLESWTDQDGSEEIEDEIVVSLEKYGGLVWADDDESEDTSDGEYVVSKA